MGKFLDIAPAVVESGGMAPPENTLGYEPKGDAAKERNRERYATLMEWVPYVAALLVAALFVIAVIMEGNRNEGYLTLVGLGIIIALLAMFTITGWLRDRWWN
jgi:L-asparagine transporter-like permease